MPVRCAPAKSATEWFPSIDRRATFGRARDLESKAKSEPLATGAFLLFVRFTRYAREAAPSAARRIRAADLFFGAAAVSAAL
jgi:hypothetical protein